MVFCELVGVPTVEDAVALGECHCELVVVGMEVLFEDVIQLQFEGSTHLWMSLD